MSETQSCRERLSLYCAGNGLDLGFGGDAILLSAITVDRELADPLRAKVSHSDPTHLVGDVSDLRWFKDNVMDYVFSSHVLEDFQDTSTLLAEWLRVLRPGGNLVLFLPDQAAYEAHCAKHHTLPNQAHIHSNFSLEFVLKALSSIGVDSNCVVYSKWPVENNPYSFDLVIRKP